jgi:hypothetical protein
MTFPRQCPFVLLVKAGRKEVKTFGSEEGRDGARREVEQGPAALDETTNSGIKPYEDDIL